ncbi:polysaccharide biosynthesis tyrosine autokinase [Synechococcus sp. CC9311]|uniref:GumC family protein n=1 Tax=Synechococcus sp. (strain CC9311) TaxID=64471 RepID=UPI0000DDA9A8|nr:polysaccharide biosynthesis tyrosine autokinase [Synechococcus sp. CC9311]ABI46364.1 Chain length determinant protein family protein [Synechococcus sp. CC9311]
MSNLIARPGQSPDLVPQTIQDVQVRDLGLNLSNLKAEASDEIDLRELWRALKRRKKIVGFTAAAVLVLSGVVTTYQRLFMPVYEGSFALLITDPISNEGGNNSAASSAASGTVFEQLARNTTQNDIPTLIEVLESPLLLAPIAKRFDVSENELAERINITTGGAKRKEAEGVLKVSLTGRNPKEDGQLLEAISAAYLQTALQQRQKRLTDGIAFLDLQAPALQAKADAIQGELAEFRRRHSLLEPAIEGTALKQREATLATQIFGFEAERSRLKRVRQDIASGSLSARGFQEAISTGSGGVVTGNQQSQGLAVSDADQSLLQQLLKVETELAEARSKFVNNSSMVLSLEARLEQLQPLLRENQLEAVDAALGLNANRLATARAQERTLQDNFLKQPALIKQYETLQTKLTLAQENLSGLVSARETFRLESAQSSVPWRVIDPPEIDPNPIKPSIPRNLALGAMLGLVAGVAAGLIRDRFDHVFHLPAEVKDDLNLPLLGHIPHVAFFKGVREDKRFLLNELDQSSNNNATNAPESRKQDRYQRFFYQEAFRNLFTSLRFLNTERPLKAVALTSSLPAEGKSLVNVLLAKTLAEMGQRVLLVDADLRKPQLHIRLGINNLQGLSNLITEDALHWRDLCKQVPGYENWSVMTAGLRPPDPTRLLSSQRMHDLVQEITQSNDFDLVLFDTPPVLGLADASLVAEHCDGLMLLVSLNRVDRGLPQEAVNRIVSSGVPLLGLITNAVSTEEQSNQFGYGKYGYGKYGYGRYGYGYGGYNSYSAALYANYADPEDSIDSSSEGAGKSLKASPTWREQLRERSRRFMQWLDN